jgi:hypothetical protein
VENSNIRVMNMRDSGLGLVTKVKSQETQQAEEEKWGFTSA